MPDKSEIYNLLNNIPTPGDDEHLEILCKTPGLRIERIISKGHCSETGFWYDQDWDEWLLVLQGKAKLEFENQPVISVCPGDSLLIKAHQRHRVQWTDPDQETIWLAVHHQ